MNTRSSSASSAFLSPQHQLAIDWPGMPEGVGAISTIRSGGVSVAPYDDGRGGGGLNLGGHVGDAAEAVARNRALLRGWLPAEPAWLHQVHGTTVVDAGTVASGMPAEADASIASGAGIVCAILTADCMPVLLADRHARVVGAAHAGWRGLAGGVIEATVERMRAAGAGDISGWLGPAIGPARFEVGEEVRDAFLQRFSALRARAAEAFQAMPDTPGKYLADLPRLARLALATMGIHEVAGGAHCTMSEPERFYSFRRDRITGRMATLIWIK